MTTGPVWQYDEFKQIGTDYGSIEEVARYDERMARLRKVTDECADILRSLDLTPESRVLDIGAGTGEFAVAAAQCCAEVCAVDISPVMLEYAKSKAKSRGLDNIVFAHAGFLTYDHNGRPFDAVVSQLALHHLPDFWKAVALRRVWHMLKDGGLLFIKDFVFSFDVEDTEPSLNGWIDGAIKLGGYGIKRDVETHIRNEYSTFGWAMEGFLQTAGFSIIDATYQNGHTSAEYLCRKA